jgi:hypothetical protein
MYTLPMGNLRDHAAGDGVVRRFVDEDEAAGGAIGGVAVAASAGATAMCAVPRSLKASVSAARRVRASQGRDAIRSDSTVARTVRVACLSA